MRCSGCGKNCSNEIKICPSCGEFFSEDGIASVKSGLLDNFPNWLKISLLVGVVVFCGYLMISRSGVKPGSNNSGVVSNSNPSGKNNLDRNPNDLMYQSVSDSLRNLTSGPGCQIIGDNLIATARGIVYSNYDSQTKWYIINKLVDKIPDRCMPG